MTREALSREGASLKKAAKYLGLPGMISLGGGLPSSEYFPFETLSVKVPTPPHFSEPATAASGTTLHAGKHDLANGRSLYDISTAFNYAQGTGSAQLLRFVTEHTELVHNPPYADWRTTLSIGSTSALDMALRMFTHRGDILLSEEYTFATAVETAAPLGVRVVGVPMDAEGLVPAALDALLSAWDDARGRKPFLLYTVPTGQNPTGATQGAARRRALYAVARKHDLFILEDEPYYFLQMQPYVGPGTPPPPPPASHAEFLASLVPSLLSMDVDGRVMRLDSFSKVVSPGARIGWVTASEQVVRAYARHADVSTQSPSGVSQLVLWKLLDEHWGHAGYLDWLIHIRLEYTRRRDVILQACERFLPKEVVSWDPPMAGMFVSCPPPWSLDSRGRWLAVEDAGCWMLTWNSTGSASPLRSTPITQLSRSRSWKRRSGWPASRPARWSCGAPGSMPTRTPPTTPCSSARRTRPCQRRSYRRPFGDLGMQSG